MSHPFHRLIHRLTLVFCLALGGSLGAAAQLPPAWTLDQVAPVQLSGSDADAADFNANVLPGLLEIVNANLSERAAIGDLDAYALNADDLTLSVDTSLRVYFIGEGAGYRNSFGIYTGDSTDKLTGDAALVFFDASKGYSYSGSTDDRYLDVGDFVDAGEFESGTQLNLFLIANGANGGRTVFYSDDTLNPDLIDHFILLASPDTSYLLVGNEDLLGGGDEDYNDLVIALEIGAANVTALISQVVPLPGPVFALLAALGFGIFAPIKRRFSQPSRGDQPA